MDLAATGGVAGWGAYSASKAAMNSLARTLGNEESSIVTVSVRPGTVATNMQTAIRETGLCSSSLIELQCYSDWNNFNFNSGQSHMLEADYKKFSALYTDGVLLNPNQPGSILAGLSINADSKLTGQFLDWNDENLVSYKL